MSEFVVGTGKKPGKSLIRVEWVSRREPGRFIIEWTAGRACLRGFNNYYFYYVQVKSTRLLFRIPSLP